MIKLYVIDRRCEYDLIQVFWRLLKARLRSWRVRTVELFDITVGQAMQALPPKIAAAGAAQAGYFWEC